MNNIALRSALSSVIEQDFAEYLAAPKHTFSAEFEERMDQLIRKEKRPIRYYWRTPGKRMVLAAFAAVFLFAVLVLASKNFEGSVLQTIRQIFSSHESTAAGPFEREIRFETVPKELKRTDCLRTSEIVLYTYQDNAGNMIRLKQSDHLDPNDPTLTPESTAYGYGGMKLYDMKQYSVEGKTVDLYVCTSSDPQFASVLAVWSLDKYTVKLEVFGDIPEETVISWIPLIQLE